MPRETEGIYLFISEIFPIVREDWVDKALCSEVDSEMFFPEPGDVGFEAKRICRLCPVRVECGQWADANGEKGIWAGKSDKERRRIRRLSKSVTAA